MARFSFLRIAIAAVLIVRDVHVNADSVYLNASSSIPSQLEISSSPGASHISLSFRTCDFSSIVLYQAGSQASTYVLLTISSGRLAAQYNTGGGVREVVAATTPVSDCEWHSVALNWTAFSVHLVVDSGSATEGSTGTLSGPVFSPAVDSNMLLGTTRRFDVSAGSVQPVASIASLSQFEGCFANMTVGTASIELQSAAIMTGVSAGCNSSDFVVEEFEIENATSLTFGSNSSVPSYALYDRSLLNISATSTDDRLDLFLRTRARNGVIFFVGEANQYLMLELVRGTPYFSFGLVGTSGTLRASTRVDDGEWHSVSVLRSGRDMLIVLNERSPGETLQATGTGTGSSTVITLPGSMFVGGLSASIPNFPTGLDLRLSEYESLVGCIQGLTFNGQELNFANKDPSSSSVAQTCFGADVCESRPCQSQNNRVCIDTFNDFNCECAPGYTGSNCDVDIDECASGPCQNGATCVDGIAAFDCLCNGSWMGPTCNIPDLCAENPCNSQGNCSQPAEGGSFTCACFVGFWGTQCDSVCEVGNCSASAVVQCRQDDGQGRQCSACSAGFYGQGCELACAPISSCDDGGTLTCRQSDGLNPRCSQCVAGFHGRSCAETCSPQTCDDTAELTCLQDSGVGLNCEACAGGYWGDVLNTDGSNDCTRVCTSSICANVTQCNITTGDAEVCSECIQANCVGDVVCDLERTLRICTECVDGFHSGDCSAACNRSRTQCVESLAVACNQSTGLGIRCDECDAGFWGAFSDPELDDCSLACADSNCTTVATCGRVSGESVECVGCAEARWGVTCQEMCVVGKCDAVNGSIACNQATGGNRSCTLCLPGWESEDCEVEIDECASNPCNGNGACTDLEAAFQCDCYEGWVGTHCNISFWATQSLSGDVNSLMYYSASLLSTPVSAGLTSVQLPSIALEFITTVSSGVVCYVQGFGTDDFAVELVSGNVVLSASTAGAMWMLQVNGAFADARWHQLRVEFASDVVELDYVQYSTNFSRAFVSADVGVALGGPPLWDQQMLNRLHSTRNFAGCIQDVYLGTELLNLHVTTRAVGASNGCARTASSCEGVTACGANGRCRDAWDTYMCDCAYGYVGENCTEVFETTTFFGNSSAHVAVTPLRGAVRNNGIDFRDPSFHLVLSFRTRDRAAVLLHVQGLMETSHSFTLRLLNASVVLQLTADGASASMGVPHPVDDGLWHRLDISRNSSTSVRIALEGQPARVFSWGPLESLNLVDGSISVGDVTGGGSGSPFIGCLRGFRINTRDIALVEVVSSEISVSVVGAIPLGCRGRDMCGVPATNPCNATTSTCEDIWNRAQCNCIAGYGPPLVCTADIDDCAPTPCVHGTCTDRLNNFTCDCSGTGFEGTRCEVNIDDCTAQSCLNGGTCVDGVLGVSCICPVQYGSNDCSEDVNECDASPCPAGGSYCAQLPIPTTCDAVCEASWLGYNCTTYSECDVGATYETAPGTRTTDRTCSNVTTCNATAYALALPTYTTDTVCANISAPCASTHFQSHAPTYSSDRVCTECSECVFGQYKVANCGNTTDVECARCNKCQHGGRCFANTEGIGYQCDCLQEYSGQDCEIVDPCLQFTLDYFRQYGTHQAPCLNSGTCNAVNGSWACACTRGRFGRRCETVVCPTSGRVAQDECNADVCTQQGTDVATLQCTCAAGWTGDNCTTQEAACVGDPCGANGICDAVDGAVACACLNGFSGSRCGIAPTTTTATIVTTSMSGDGGGSIDSSATADDDSTSTSMIGIIAAAAAAALVVLIIIVIVVRSRSRRNDYVVSNEFYNPAMSKSDLASTTYSDNDSLPPAASAWGESQS
eukprot:m.1424026 g.1424026  ORF g.1424026 m.1424026 type:complete len:1820 (+) comp25059_c0_seq1:205-5664(+)